MYSPWTILAAAIFCIAIHIRNLSIGQDLANDEAQRNTASVLMERP